MATPDDIENRLSAVERDVAELREQTALASTDASAARTLAAGADRDVSEVRSELRSHTSALNALRETQLELHQTQVETGQTMTQGFATMSAGIAQILHRLDDLSGRND